MSTSLELSYLMRLVLEAAAFGAVAAFGTAFRRRGPWAVLAAVGGCLGVVVALVSLQLMVA